MRIEGFDDLRPIGHGGLGDVYRAERLSTGGPVAIKVLRDVSDSSVAWHRTRRELTALVSLSGHAHVIRLLELLDLPTGPALVMEYAPGGSVADLLATRPGDTLDVAEIVLIGRQAADALDAAHDQDIVHRDVKPQNLLIDGYGQIKLCDFGIASLTRSEEFRTRTSALSMRYASPEDLDEDAEVGPASDVYSLGATLLHLAHGAPPTLKERLAPWQPPASRDDSADADRAALDQVIAACLHPEPRERPTAAEVLDRLEELDWQLTDRCRALPVVEPTDEARTPHLVEADQNDVGEPVDVTGDDRGESVAPAAAAALFGDDTSASTVLRPDRPRPAARPDPTPTRRDQRWPWIVAAIAVAALVGVGLALLWPNDADAPESSTSDTTADTAPPPTEPAVTPATTASTAAAPAVSFVVRPSDVPELGGDDITWPFGPVGECLVLEAGADTLTAIGCDEPHDLQRFEVDSLDADAFPPDAEFVADAVGAGTNDACRAAFIDFVGSDPGTSEFEIAVTRPSADTWADGDRGYQRLLGLPDARLVGDAAGSGQ